jgi:hypothetical protein
MSTQPNLFRLPSTARFKPTPAQLALLDLLLFYDGALLPETIGVKMRPVLRRLIDLGLVEVAMSARGSVYKVTQVGRLVRAK